MRWEDERKMLIKDVSNNFGLSNWKDEISNNWDGEKTVGKTVWQEINSDEFRKSIRYLNGNVKKTVDIWSSGTQVNKRKGENSI